MWLPIFAAYDFGKSVGEYMPNNGVPVFLMIFGQIIFALCLINSVRP